MEKHSKPLFCALTVCVLLLGVVLAYTVFKIHELQKGMESLRVEGLAEAYDSGAETFAAALEDDKIESVLLLGDSISDNNGAWNHIFGQERRAETGCRLILTDSEEGPYYEDNPNSQGWSWYFRQYLLETTSVTTFHNNAIGGKSAKWFNARKELAIPQDYDAIVIMLGTNDSVFCDSVGQFRKEYKELLAYAAEHCEYLQVLSPIPAFAPEEDKRNIPVRRVAEEIVDLCADRGYSCVDLYKALPAYAAGQGMSLEEFYFGDVHPSPSGHYHLWRAIAGELGLELELSGKETPKSFDILDAVFIGQNREDVTETTPLSAQTDGKDIFPQGISLYWLYQVPFIDGAPDTGVVVTYKYGPTSGKQIFRARDETYVRVRYTDGDAWGPWQIADFE